MESFDVIIVGAGPAGLLLAKELSKKHKVIILEKNKIGDTNKSWVSYKDILTEEIHNLIFKHHKIRIKDMYD